jgi:hypothetical protein
LLPFPTLGATLREDACVERLYALRHPTLPWPLGRRAYRRLVTYEELLAIARAAEGVTLETTTGRRFRVGIYLDCPVFTPESTGRGGATVGGRPNASSRSTSRPAACVPPTTSI